MTGVVAIIVATFFFGWKLVQLERAHQRELGRFIIVSETEQSLDKKIDRFFDSLGKRFVKQSDKKNQAKQKDRDMNEKLRQAGFEAVGDQAKFALVRLVCYGSWPIMMGFAWFNFSTYYATVSSVFSFAFVVLAPHLLLSRKALHRRESIQRELPLVIDLTNLATSAGWDISVALERVVGALGDEYPGHPLINELKRAKWLASSGYTWSEGLDLVVRRLNDDTVTRVAKALIQAMEQGGDRSEQLGGIAQDAQRSYYATLDKRLAAIPVKSLVITMMLFLTYFVVLLAPAGVGIQSSFLGF